MAELRGSGGRPRRLAYVGPETAVGGGDVAESGGAAGGGAKSWPVQSGENVGLYDVRMQVGESGGSALLRRGLRGCRHLLLRFSVS